ncbi:MAG: hypothetical protein PVSMB7_19370 [Chloroflexota bacterium]
MQVLNVPDLRILGICTSLACLLNEFIRDLDARSRVVDLTKSSDCGDRADGGEDRSADKGRVKSGIEGDNRGMSPPGRSSFLKMYVRGVSNYRHREYTPYGYKMQYSIFKKSFGAA